MAYPSGFRVASHKGYTENGGILRNSGTAGIPRRRVDVRLSGRPTCCSSNFPLVLAHRPFLFFLVLVSCSSDRSIDLLCDYIYAPHICANHLVRSITRLFSAHPACYGPSCGRPEEEVWRQVGPCNGERRTLCTLRHMCSFACNLHQVAHEVRWCHFGLM